MLLSNFSIWPVQTDVSLWLYSHLLECMWVWASFHVFVGYLELLFCELPIHILGSIFCCGVYPCLIYLFCKSSLYIIAIYPLSDLWVASPPLLPNLVFICWLSSWYLFQIFLIFILSNMYICPLIASEFPVLIKKLSPILDFTCDVLVLFILFNFLHLGL